MRTIPQRELRNHVSRVLREVEAGESIQITVDGRPVAVLSPVAHGPRTFVPLKELLAILQRAPLDPDFAKDIEFITGQTLDDF